MSIHGLSSTASSTRYLNTLEPGGGGGGDRSPYVVTTSESLNLRSAPMDGEIVASMPGGSVISVLSDPSRADGWAMVSFDGEFGWAMVGEEAGYARQIAPHEAAAVEAGIAVHLNQIDDWTALGQSIANANCGPASLAMAFELQRLQLPLIPGDDPALQSIIQRARFAMHGDYEAAGTVAPDALPPGLNANKDGVRLVASGADTASGDYELAPSENSGSDSYTGPVGVRRATELAGGSVETLATTSSAVQEALDGGATVIVSGYNGEIDHVVVVVGHLDGAGFIVNDPLSAGPEIWPDTRLGEFMDADSGTATAVRGVS